MTAMRHVMNIDLETYSEADLKSAGVYAYAQHKSFDILLIGYRIDGGPVWVIDLAEGKKDTTRDEQMELIRLCYPEFFDALLDPETLKTAYNANFERTCLAAFFGEEMPPEQWQCTAVHAATLGLPGNLEGVGAALGLPEDKQKDKAGKELIRYFCKPCKPTKANGGRTRNLPEDAPEKWAQFVEYNRQDVVTESAIRERLEEYPVTEKEWKLWQLDQRMNDNGIRVDLGMVENILAFDAKYQEELMDEARKITGLANPNSLPQLKGWLLERYGLDVKSITKDTLPGIMEALKDEPAGLRMMQIRAELGKTSTKKYAAMKESVCPDGRIRGILQFYGASRTGRWSGRILQVQNLPQNKIPDIELARELAAEGDFDTMRSFYKEGIPFIFSQLIRTALIPSEGCTFVVADFSAIEARVVAWLAGEQWVLDAFKAGKDIYCETASMMYHVPVVKHGVNGELRQKGKIATLACGYGGGVGAIKAMDKSGSVPEEEMQSVIDHWRTANPNIVKLWRSYEVAAKAVIRDRRPISKHIKGTDAPPLVFSYKGGNLFIKLPSGRKLCYYGARVDEGDDLREHITYEGIGLTKQWERLETWGGKLVENVVQAVARDCLAETMTGVSAAGYQIVMHVHDELICDVPVREDGNRSDLDAVLEIMKHQPDWAPGLPLKGDGYVTPFYKKD